MPSRKHPPKSDTGGPVAAPAVGGLRSLGGVHLLRLLGKGGMSEVYLGFHDPSGRTVAVKVIADHLAGDPGFLSRFGQEAYLSRKLEHRNLVRGLACGRDPETRREFLVMEFVDGPTAQEQLEKRGRLYVAEAVRITLDIARALEYLHQNRYVHRDIKPGNILLSPDGGAKLADLGVAKSLTDATQLTSLDQGIGTPYYMSWEQTLNAGLVDYRSDLFSLGATLYHLLTGRVPFPGDSDEFIARMKERGHYRPASDVEPRLPKELDAILGRLLCKDPRGRFRNATELIDVLTASGLADYEEPGPAAEPVPADPLFAPTRADLHAGAAGEDTPINPSPLWLLRFRKEGGPVRSHRGTTADVRRWYAEGLLPDNTRAARQPEKRYRPLRAYPEFRGIDPAETPPAAPATGAVTRRKRRPAGDGVMSLNLGLICLTGLVSMALSAAMLVWMFVTAGPSH